MATDRYSDDYTIVVGGGGGTMTVDSDLEITGGLLFTGNLAIPGNLSVTGSITGTDLNLLGSGTSNIISAAGDIALTSSTGDVTVTCKDTLGLYTGVGGTVGEIIISPSGPALPSFVSVYITLSESSDEIVIAGPNLSINSDIVAIDSNSVTIDSNAGNIEFTASGVGNDINLTADGIVYLRHSSNNSSLILQNNHLDVLTNNQGSGSLTEYAASIANAWNSNNADVLYLRTFYSGTSGSGNNFIVFFDGNSGANDIGSIEGDGAGGISLNSGGADYAEWMIINDESEWSEYFHLKENNILGIPEGTLVWIKNSKIYRNEIGTPMIITNRAIVCGNSPKNSFYKPSSEIGERVSFIGQVPVIVEGPVKDGDYLIPKLGENYCTAIAKSQITFEQYKYCIGTSWGNSDGSGMSKVNCAVGIK
jgi:glycerophosphoryl diester phosphodiesterase